MDLQIKEKVSDHRRARVWRGKSPGLRARGAVPVFVDRDAEAGKTIAI